MKNFVTGAAFAALSKATIPLRDEIDGDRPDVAHCSMAGESWLQDSGPVANPYYGSRMLRGGGSCAEP